MRAAELGHVAALKILKEANADSTLKDIDGKGFTPRNLIHFEIKELVI